MIALLLLLTLLIPTTAPAQRVSPTLAPLWASLDDARQYRGDFAERDGNSRRRLVNQGTPLKSHADVIRDYQLPMGASPRETLPGLLGPDGFGGFLDSPNRALAAEAAQGFQETLNEIMAGESLIANQRLLQGLRSRYPFAGDPADVDQTTLLTESVDVFRNAVELAGNQVRARPDGFRAASDLNPRFPFFVENQPTMPGAEGEIVESDYFRFTDLVNRYGLAANSLGRRLFFFGNVDEDEDDGAEGDGRREAAEHFQNTANAIYLNAVLLAATQTTGDFQNNFGSELKRHVNDAEQLFQDIRSGFNPLTLRGDFVPFQPLENLLDGARSLVVSAQAAESAARIQARQYDEDEAALTEELRNQTEEYLDQVDILLGVVIEPDDDSCSPPDENDCDLTLPEDRDTLERLAENEDYLSNCDATICNFFRSWEAAQIDLREAQDVLFGTAEQIRIEERRSGTIVGTIRDTGAGVAALNLAQGIAQAAAPTISFAGPPIFMISEFDPDPAIEGIFQSQQTVLETVREVRVEQSESAAAVENLLLEHATQAIAVERAMLAVVEARADYTASIGDLRRFVRNFVGAREELNEAYLTNPAYRLQLELAQQNAEATFEAAIVGSYNAAKALEYEWAERFQNPVPQTEPGENPIPIGEVAANFAGIIRAESAFAVRSAGTDGSAAPSLRRFVQALEQWDIRMRQDRGPLRQEGQTVTISLKEEILGFNSDDAAFNRLAFRDYVSKHRFPGLNPLQPDLIVEFPIQIGDQRILPAVPNLKILSLGVDMVTVPGRSLRASPSPNPPLIDLVMTDDALTRTFFHDFPDDDDFLILDLQGARSFRRSQFFAQVEATIDGGGTAAPNTQLANRSPAVSRWVLRIEMDLGVNTTLLLENLDDIKLVVTYTFGHPPDFDFPFFSS